MKLKKSFVISTVAGETVGVPVAGSFHGIVKANSTAAFVLDCLKKDITRDQLVEKLTENYDVSRETAAADVDAMLEKLRSISVLEE